MHRRAAITAITAIALMSVVAAGVAASACGSGDGYNASPSRAGTPRASSTSSPTVPAARTTPTPPVTSATTGPSPAPDAPVTSADTPSPATPTIAVPLDHERILAPIDAADIIIRESFPPQYAVRVVSGLPNGCTLFAGITTARAGDQITITVENSVPRDKNIACTQIYGTHEETIELGSDFTPGATYTVKVNDRTLTLTAQ